MQAYHLNLDINHKTKSQSHKGPNKLAALLRRHGVTSNTRMLRLLLTCTS